MTDINQILESTFQQMPNIFTSNQFALRLEINGAPREVVTNGIMLAYEREHANPLGKSEHRNRTWIKKQPVIEQQVINFELTDEVCIEHLKSRGYRILKMQEVEV